jgi:hypothetical protein
MGSVGAVNPGVGDLLQALYNNNSSLSPVLSSSAVESAIQTASPADLVQLSAQALQLQQTGDLFGAYDPASQISGPGATLLQALEEQDSAGQAASAASSAAAPQVNPALAEADDLFGYGNSTISLLG